MLPSFVKIEQQYRLSFANYTVPATFKPALGGDFDQLLISFLQQSPINFDFRIPITPETSDTLSHILWFKLCGGSRHLFSKLSSKSSELLPTGKACGYMFKKGDGVFRCLTCGLDNTCVMCSTCFKATGHDSILSDHDTSK